MKKRKILMTAVFLGALLLTACSDTGDTVSQTPSKSTQAQTQKAVQKTTEADSGVDFSETIGVWTYGKDILYHAKDGKRYSLTESTDGSIKDINGKTYAIHECDYKLYSIVGLEGEAMTVKEGRYNESFLNSADYPDGYKTMVVGYKKSDLFNHDELEEAIAGGVPSEEEPETTQTESETVPETEIETEPVTTEQETEPPTEPTAEAESETQSEETSSEEALPADDTAEYAAIYKDLEDFLETDNFKQKDNSNRALEVFNHLHNLSNPNIEQNSIENDTSKNEVRFKCYDKYQIIINVEESTITVTETE